MEGLRGTGLRAPPSSGPLRPSATSKGSVPVLPQQQQPCSGHTHPPSGAPRHKSGGGPEQKHTANAQGTNEWQGRGRSRELTTPGSVPAHPQAVSLAPQPTRGVWASSLWTRNEGSEKGSAFQGRTASNIEQSSWTAFCVAIVGPMGQAGTGLGMKAGPFPPFPVQSLLGARRCAPVSQSTFTPRAAGRERSPGWEVVNTETGLPCARPPAGAMTYPRRDPERQALCPRYRWAAQGPSEGERHAPPTAGPAHLRLAPPRATEVPPLAA